MKFGASTFVIALILAATLAASCGEQPAPPPIKAVAEATVGVAPERTATERPLPTPFASPTPAPEPPRLATVPTQTPAPSETPKLAIQPTTINGGGGHTCGLRVDGTATCWGHNFDGQSSPPSGEIFAAVSAGFSHTCALRKDGTARCWGHDSGSSAPGGETFAAISAGEDHTCGLRADGTARCWGDNNAGQSSPPSSETFVAVSAGGEHACGLRADGTAVCWGNNEYGQSSPPGGETFAAISAGGIHACGLRADGTAVCWGDDRQGQSSPPGGGTFAAINAGHIHTCALRVDGAARCWGNNELGQSSPPGGETFTAIASGSYHACALREDGTARCWGYNDFGQSSPPSGETFATSTAATVPETKAALAPTPTPIAPAPSDTPNLALQPTAKTISAGEHHTCALREDGTARCWGHDSGSSAPGGETFAAISAGNAHTCGLRADGTATCWGRNSYGESSPPRLKTFAYISAGKYHTCGLGADGTATCWGDNGDGESSPPGGETFVAISAGGYHTCGLGADGTATCWGRNDEGQSSPPSGETFAAISAGYFHTCALREDGTARCWGDNPHDGLPLPSETFAAISAGQFHTCGLRASGEATCWGGMYQHLESAPSDETFTAISAGYVHACALHVDGAATCWGMNRDGQASPPSGETFATAAAKITPAPVPTPNLTFRSATKTISAGGSHTCGLRADGTAVCWGRNEYGQSSPPSGETFTEISAGAAHTCGLREDGTATCWGVNDEYQSSPPSGETFTEISASASYTCALREDGTARCWGTASHSASGGETFATISAGSFDTCALGLDGIARCGENGFYYGLSSPLGGETFTAISAGGHHTCALRVDGTARCWGRNLDGQASPPGGEAFTAISAGWRHTCGLRADGTAVCWGWNEYGESSPPGGEAFAAISAGGGHTCGLRADGTAVCWGENEHGESSPPSGETFATAASAVSPADTAPDSVSHRGSPISCGLAPFAGNLNEIQCVYTHPDENKPNRDRVFRIHNLKDAEWSEPVSEARLAKWLLEGQDALDELGMVYAATLSVFIKDLGDSQGEVGDAVSIVLGASPGYDSMDEMRATVAHELFHHAQRSGSNQILNTFGGSPRAWLLEGSAQWFVDEVYDDRDWWYQAVGTGIRNEITKAQLAGGLANLAPENDLEAYARASFFKLLDKACPKSEGRHVVASIFRGFLSPVISSGVTDVENAVKSHNCDFGGHLGEDKRSSLEAAMAYYNYATMFSTPSLVLDGETHHLTLYGGKVSLLDSNEASDDCRYYIGDDGGAATSGLCFQRPIPPYAGAAPLRISMNPTSARSFLTEPGILPMGKKAKLTIAASHPLTVSIVGDTTGGESDVSPNGENAIGRDGDPHYWFAPTGPTNPLRSSGNYVGSFTYGIQGRLLPELLVTLVTPGRGLFTNQVTVTLEIADAP